MNNEERNCAFQYAYTTGRIFRQTTIVQDKSGLTLDEAIELYRHHKKDIIKKLQNEDVESLEAVIWTGMIDSYSYKGSLIYITHDYKTDGEKIWQEVKEYINI